MKPATITADIVRQTLRAIRTARPLDDAALLHLDAVTVRLSAERLADSPEARAAFLSRWLDDITWEQVLRLRGEDLPATRVTLSPKRSLELLKSDYDGSNVDREAWGILYYRYFSGSRQTLLELADVLGVSYATLRRRVDRGYHALAGVLRNIEREAYTAIALGHNVPEPLTRFIGRDQELADIRRLLAAHRLVTLTGPGGIGKSRLAIHLARDLASDFADSAWFVEMAALEDDRQVPLAVVDALGLREQPGRSLADTLVDHLADMSLLLVLDNCEHVVAASSDLVGVLLGQCPSLQVLATSREALHVDGQAVFSVPPMALPAEPDAAPVAGAMHFDAVRLFGGRAAAAKPGFRVDADNAVQVTRICATLDGIPLAIELAGARARFLTLDQLEGRLADRFQLLKDGRHASRQGHETLLATMDWSYQLLDGPERALLRRLSVFRGGWTLDAAEAVCSGDGIEVGDVLELLTQLESKSLISLRQDGRQPRFHMLETVRQYAWDRLRSADEARATERRHLDYWLTTGEAESSYGRTSDFDGTQWLSRVEVENANVRAVLEWSASRGGDDRVAGLELAVRASRSWYDHARFSQGGLLLAALLEGADHVDASLRSSAYGMASVLARSQGDNREALVLAEQNLSLASELEDGKETASALSRLATIHGALGDYSMAQRLCEEALALSRDIGYDGLVGPASANLASLALRQGDYGAARARLEQRLATVSADTNSIGKSYLRYVLASVAIEQGEYDEAHALLEQALHVMQSQDDNRMIPSTLRCLGAVALARGDLVRAGNLFRDGLAMARENREMLMVAVMLSDLAEIDRRIGRHDAALKHALEGLSIQRDIEDPFFISVTLNTLGLLAIDQGDLTTAADRFCESIAASWTSGALGNVSASLEGMGRLALARGENRRATRLLGAASGLRESLHSALTPHERSAHEAARAAAEAALGTPVGGDAWSAGRALTLDEAVAYALGEVTWDELADEVAARVAAAGEGEEAQEASPE